jgi:phosphohistidine phosphatase SixA
MFQVLRRVTANRRVATFRRPALFPLVVLLTTAASAAAGGPPDRSLVDDLRKGGYVLYLRHFATDHDRDDTDPFHLENVAAQRRLTDQGRRQATAVGEALRALAIPVGSVVCSQFDRARESARLMAVGEPVPTADVSAPASASSSEEKERRTNALRKLLSTAPPAGKNTLIVSHNSNLRAAAGEEFTEIGEGEIVVFQPTGERSFRAVARVYPPSIWTEWSKPTP